MLPREHAKSAFALTMIIAPHVGWRAAALAGAAAVLIDIDHYFWYVLSFHRFDPREAYDYFRKPVHKERNSFPGSKDVFHTIEAITLLGLISLRSYSMRFILLGCTLHLALDLYDDWISNGQLDRHYTFLPKIIRQTVNMQVTHAG